MPHPFYMRKPEKKSPKVGRKSESVGRQIKQIFTNIGEIIKILVKWR